ncbi:MAG: hypothetical protein N2167_10095 [Flavobacteriales bacterium]|nr:hypothetical protein [Flavobacteriales bacterium]
MKLISNWDFARLLRLGLAVILGIYAWYEANGMIGVLAAWIGIQVILNFGCFGNQGCHIPSVNKSKQESQEITYEEITTDKKS